MLAIEKNEIRSGIENRSAELKATVESLFEVCEMVLPGACGTAADLLGVHLDHDREGILEQIKRENVEQFINELLVQFKYDLFQGDYSYLDRLITKDMEKNNG